VDSAGDAREGVSGISFNRLTNLSQLTIKIESNRLTGIDDCANKVET
jgi:hypothetical protein